MFLCTATNILEIMSQARGRIVAAPPGSSANLRIPGRNLEISPRIQWRVGVVWEYHGYMIQPYITNHQYIYIIIYIYIVYNHIYITIYI